MWRDMPVKKSSDRWQRADEEVRKNLPAGVKHVCTLRGPTTIVRIAWSPDGQMLASLSSDGSIHVWDTASRHEVRASINHPKGFSAFAWSPDSKTIALSARDERIQFWSITSGELADGPLQSPEPVLCVAWDPSGRQLACSSCGENEPRHTAGGLWILDILSQRFDKLPFAMTGVEIKWSPDGRRIANGGYWGDGVLDLVDVTKSGSSTGQINARYGGWSNCFDLDWASDGSIIVSGSQDGTVKVWDPSSGKLMRSLEGHTSQLVSSVSLSSRCQLLASVAVDETLRIWRCDKWEQSAVIPWLVGEGCSLKQMIDFSPTSSTLAVAEKREIHILELDLAGLLGEGGVPSAHYVNAKVVLVGDTGVGKTGLSLEAIS
ncbi:MAG TPA: hypothetical protein VL486_14415 [Verrucomicrobiae bacterium]|nr:hypothetical protein [Verrucomicrobiae bacterium]